MIVNNALKPNRRAGQAVGGTGSDEPFVTISLLKFKAKADYPDEPDSPLTGGEAYALYLAALPACLAAIGARLAYAGPITGVDVGEMDEPWDMAGVVEYPSAASVRTLMALPAYLAIMRHRDAGLAGQFSLRVGVGA